MLEKRTAGEPEYDIVAKLLHWLTAVLLLLQFSIAWTMPEIHRGTKPERLINLHLSFGMVILLVIILRLVWRLGHQVPLVNGRIPFWQYRAAQASHALLYLLLLALPFMGWANASSRGWTVHLFSLVTLPQILPTGSPLGHELGDIHTSTSYLILALVALHLAAALYHQFWLRDGLLSRMA